ncbi:hypothetical protein JAAARDRAFT_193803 [Jaapia argillacea MUCL 33604]|uniref:Uncharacterized protein n=1 Tax=Jaapia argillacea MUCL 33604 TaxID=933084 RepID=A0A067Q4H4_9AGAM|nr:hypothetical protein JAAARDRAFT_193803 [Jaapia argillacea MUCL 33604]
MAAAHGITNVLGIDQNGNPVTLRQVSLDTVTGTKRKRILTISNGGVLDLQGPFLPVTPEVVEAMRLRIIELEDELASQRPTKRAKAASSSALPEAPVAGPSNTVSAAATKAEEKKKKIQLKKMYDRVKKECKSDTCKFQGSPKTIKFDEVLEFAEFQNLFVGKGRLVQPTLDNKPKSTVWIVDYTTQAELQELFGDELKPLKGNRWSVGGVPTRGGGFGFGGGSTFSKSSKIGAVDVEVTSLEVNYSKNTMKCSLKFEVRQIGGGGYDSDGYW